MNTQATKMTRSQLISLLENETVVVKFTKKDGTVRLMKCTTDPARLPDDVKFVEKVGDHNIMMVGIAQSKNEDAPVICYDLELNAWRTFYADKVIDVSWGMV